MLICWDVLKAIRLVGRHYSLFRFESYPRCNKYGLSETKPVDLMFSIGDRIGVYLIHTINYGNYQTFRNVVKGKEDK